MPYPLRSLAAVHRRLHHVHDLGRSLLHALRRDAGPPADARPLLRVPAPPPAVEAADLFLVNARFLEAPPGADTLAVGGGRILALGTEEALAPLRGSATRVVDAQGAWVAPGLCDAHLHLMVGAERVHACDVEGMRTVEQITRALREYAAAHPQMPVLHGYGLPYTNPPLWPAERARAALDEILDDRPLVLYAHDLHTVWANTRAIEEAGLLRPMPPWPPLLEALHMEGGLVLGPDGLPGGEFREPETYFLVDGPLRARHPLTPAQKLEGFRHTVAHLHARGVTAVHAMGLGLPAEDLETLLLLLQLEQEGNLGLRVTASLSAIPDEHMPADIARAATVRDALREAREGTIRSGELHRRLLRQLEEAVRPRHPADPEHGSGAPLRDALAHLSDLLHHTHARAHRHHLERMKAGHAWAPLPPDGLVECDTVKIFLDGVVEKDTAYRFDTEPAAGIPAFTRESLAEAVRLADRAGLQVAAHCIGDAAVAMFLDAVEAARRENRETDLRRGHRVRHRVEHIELCRREDIPRFAALDVVASMQALHERPPQRLWHRKVPPEKWATAFPWRLLLSNGARLAFGSDWPIVPADCVAGMSRAIHRMPWMESLPPAALDPAQALRAYSAGAAYAAHGEAVRGALVPGMAADLVLLRRAPGSVAASDTAASLVGATFVAGAPVYSRETEEETAAADGETRPRQPSPGRADQAK